VKTSHSATKECLIYQEQEVLKSPTHEVTILSTEEIPTEEVRKEAIISFEGSKGEVSIVEELNQGNINNPQESAIEQ
jgi:hypothetical protein